MDQEERERLNPSNVLIRVLMIHTHNQFETDSRQRIDRKLYSYFVNKNSNMIDIKDKVRKDFGFDLDQMKLYFRYIEVQNQVYLMDIENFDVEEDIIICITIGLPKTKMRFILRDPLEDIKIADVRFLNSTDRGEPHKMELQFDIAKFDVDNDKLPWPVYRDFTTEAAYLSDNIVKCKNHLLSDEHKFMLQSGLTQTLHTSQQLIQLCDFETQLKRLYDDFKRASLYAVHLVVKKNPTPLNLFNLYGDDGDKYVVGGIMLRRAKGWTICGHTFSEFQNMATTVAVGANQEGGTSANITEISGKIASLDVRNLALMRNKLENLIVPLACIVDYYGIKFETQSLVPLSINSLVYGSDTDGLLFSDED